MSDVVKLNAFVYRESTRGCFTSKWTVCANSGLHVTLVAETTFKRSLWPHRHVSNDVFCNFEIMFSAVTSVRLSVCHDLPHSLCGHHFYPSGHQKSAKNKTKIFILCAHLLLGIINHLRFSVSDYTHLRKTSQSSYFSLNRYYSLET